MRINAKMKIRHVAGEHILITQSDEGADMTKVVAFNESALHLYENLLDRNFGLQDVVDLLLDTYDVDPDTARHDAEAWIAEMRQHHIIID